MVSECLPTARSQRSGPTVPCRHWKWEGWEVIHTGMVGVLLSPAWSAAWHEYSAPKLRSASGRVLSIALPRDLAEGHVNTVEPWVVTRFGMRWRSLLARAMIFLRSRGLSQGYTSSPRTLWLATSTHKSMNMRVAASMSRLACWGAIDRATDTCWTSLLFEPVAAMGEWVQADSFRPALGNRHRRT